MKRTLTRAALCLLVSVSVVGTSFVGMERPAAAVDETPPHHTEIPPLESEPLVEPELTVPEGDFLNDPLASFPEVGDVLERGETFNVFKDEDGRSRAEIHGVPVNWLDGEEWVPIDQTLRSVDGRLANGSAPVKVSFGPTAAADVVSVKAADGAWSSSFGFPGLLEGVRPVADGPEARYPDVLPGVDLVYSLTSTSLKQQFIVKNAAGASSVLAPGVLASTIEGDGVSIGERDGSVELARDGTPVAAIPAGFAFDASADRGTGPAHVAVPVQLVGTDSVTLQIDAAWLLSPERKYPITIDPTVTWNAGDLNGGVDSFSHAGVPTRSLNGYDQHDSGWLVDKVQTGWHRTYMKFDLNPVRSRPIYAGQLSARTVLRSGSGDFRILPLGTEWSPNDGQVNSASWNSPPLTLNQPPVLVVAPEPGIRQNYDITTWVGNWASGLWTNYGLQLDAQHVANSNIWFGAMEEWVHGYDPYLAVWFDGNAPGAPTNPQPATGSVVTTTTPSLTASPSTDPDGQAVRYQFRVATGNDAATGQVATSGWLTTPSWSIPTGVLRDGVTYYWTAISTDGAQTNQTSPVKLTVNLRLGATGPSPFDAVGPVTVNLATGNAVVSTGSPTVNTVGGPVGLTYTYNSQAPGVHGLRGEYFNNCNPYDPNGLRKPDLVRTDTSINYGGGSPAPGISGDDFCARWSGYITVPRTNPYCVDLASDDGVRVWLNGQLVVDRWDEGAWYSPPFDYPGTCPTLHSRTNEITVEYFQRQGGGHAQLWVQGPDVGTIPVPANWLSEQPRSLPVGWSVPAPLGGELSYASLTVTSAGLTLHTPDGASYEYRSTSDQSFVPPSNDSASVSVAADASGTRVYLVRGADGITYTFNYAGRLTEAVADSDLGSTSTAPVYTYDTDAGRLASIKDPIGNRTLLTMTYSVTNGTNPCPVPSSDFSAPPNGMLCRINYLGSATETQLLYNAAGQLTRIVDPGSEITDFRYEDRGLLTNIRDPRAWDLIASGKRTNEISTYTAIVYDAAGKVDSVWPPAPALGVERALHYYRYSGGPPVAGTTHVYDPYIAPEGTRYVRRVTFDSLGRETSSTNTAGLQTTTSWVGSSDRVQTVTAPGGKTVTTQYDDSERPISVTGPGPEYSTTVYDENLRGLAATWWSNKFQRGAPAFRTLGVGHPTQALVADWGSGSPHSSLPVDGLSARFTGKVRTQAAGQYLFYMYSDDGARVYVNDELVLDSWTDGASSPVRNPLRGITLASETWYRIRVDYYENWGPASVNLAWTAPVTGHGSVPGDRLRPDYGLVSRSIEADEANGVAQNLETKTEYANPADGLPTASVVDPGGLNLRSTTGYEPAGRRRRSSRALPKGNTSTYSYYGDTESAPATGCDQAAGTQAGHLKQVTEPDPDGSGAGQPIIRQFAYDAWGRIAASRVVGDSRWTCTSYDSRGRVTSTIDRTGRATGITYSLNGTTTASFIDSSGTLRGTTEEIDILGRQISYKDEWGTVTSREFDRSSRPTNTYRSLFGGAKTLLTTIGYDPGTLRPLSTTEHVSGTARTSTISYDAAGRPSMLTRPNGVITTTGYVANTDRVASINNTKNGSELSPWTYTYTPGGKVKTEATTGRTRQFLYDRASRLTRATEGATVRNYFWDANSNRCSTTASCGAGDTYRYDNADRITSSPFASSYQYLDGHGNLTRANLTSAEETVPFNDSAALDALNPTTDSTSLIDVAAGTVHATVSTSAMPVYEPLTINDSVAAGASKSTSFNLHGSTYIRARLTWSGSPAPVMTVRVTGPTGATLATATGSAGTLDLAAIATTVGSHQILVTNNGASGTSSYSLVWSRTRWAGASGTDATGIAAGATDANGSLSTAGIGVTGFSVNYPKGTATVTDPPVSGSLGFAGTATRTINATAAGTLSASVDWTQPPTTSGTTTTGSLGPGTTASTLVPARGAALIKADLVWAAGNGGHAPVTVRVKNPSGVVVASTAASNGTASVSHFSTSTGNHAVELVNESSTLTVPSYSLTWSSTSTSTGAISGTIPTNSAVTAATLTADGAGWLTASAGYAKASHGVPATRTGSVPAKGTSSTTFDVTGTGPLSASIDWAGTTASLWSPGTLLGFPDTGVPEVDNLLVDGSDTFPFTVSGTGKIVADISWAPGPTPELPDFRLELYRGDLKVATSDRPTGQSERIEFDVSHSLSTPAGYVVRVVNKSGPEASYTLTGSYPVTANVDVELYDPSNTLVASATNSATGKPEALTYMVPPGGAGTYTLRTISRDHAAGYTANATVPTLDHAAVTARIKDRAGAVVATSTAVDGSVAVAYRAPAAGTYTVELVNASTALSVPSFSGTTSRPQQRTTNVDLELRNPSGVVVATAATTNKPEALTYAVPTNATGAYTLHMVSRDYDTTYTASGSHAEPAFATVVGSIKDPSGAVVASATSSSGSLTVDYVRPASGTYTWELRNASTGVAVPSYTFTKSEPAPTPYLGVTVNLKNASGAVVKSASGSESVFLLHVVPAGNYTLEVSPTSGYGTATISGAYSKQPRLIVGYDGNDHAVSIDNGVTTTNETLAPSGRVLARQVVDLSTGQTQENTIFGYDGSGDSPAYSRPAAGGTVTTYLGGPLSATYTGTTGSWPITNGHGDIVGTTDINGTFTAAPVTDEFGVGEAPADRLGWLGAHQRRTADPISGLIRMGVRLYDPSLGRFHQVDPIEGGSCNAYEYACGDAINNTDLDGQRCWTGVARRERVWDAKAKKWKTKEHCRSVARGIKRHKVGIVKGAGLALAVAAIPATGGASIYLGLAATGLTVTAEAMDSKPCRGERIGLALGLGFAGFAAGSLFAGAAQSADDIGMVGIQRTAQFAGTGLGVSGLAGEFVRARC